MTGPQLRALRESRGLTRKEFADQLGDCTASTLNKWEAGIHAVPAWVEERAYREVEIALPLQDLHALLDVARDEGVTFHQILAQAVREYIAQRRAPSVIPFPASTAKTPVSKPDTPHQLARVAEDATQYEEVDLDATAADVALVNAATQGQRAKAVMAKHGSTPPAAAPKP
ncbi:MAG: transcriptional regulator [Verrucomicrobiaceae bacterium]|nr:transcriptional regulator [Verrucomicrobiaceae bacterium]